MIKSVLFICTGNSCRSVMAQGLLRKYLKEHSREDIKVSSAGISVIEGMMPTSSAIEVMKKEFVDVSGHRACRVSSDMVKGADLILAMEPIHLQTVIGIFPEAKDKTHLLLEYADAQDTQKNKNPYVFDPIGKPKEVYEEVFLTLKDAIEKMGERICESR